MYVLKLAIGAGISLLFLVLLFVPMERVFPAKKNQPFFRKKWFLDLSFFLGQYLFWNSLLIWFLYDLHTVVDTLIPGKVIYAVHTQPVWIQAVEVLFLSDFLIYWGHRLQHKVDFLWRFHKVHHTAETMDWLAAHREHPLDTIYTVGLINLPVFLLGFNLDAVMIIVVFRGIWAIYIHSNVRLNIGFVQKIIGSPALHHWHHDLERDRGNYSNVSPLMDLLFGTYVCPDQEPEKFGIKEEFPQNYLGQLVVPLVPKFILRKFLKGRKTVVD
ncbi:sterol desaturase family protein [Fluviicola sp.]|uniref:sterol desaturase family protein n=1 Tax=Fluviicola sp. TaxID=1917219 RepID=UPI0031D27B1A